MRRLAISGALCLPSLIAAVALADAPLRINEVRLEQPGKDTEEYIEIAGAPGESLAGLFVVVIGDDDFALPGQQNGVIEEVVPLSGAIPTSGFFVVAESKFSIGFANLVTDLNLEGADNVTFLLVRGFNGFEGQKLDTNDDGTLDITPWTEIVSSIAVLETSSPNGVASDYFYSTATVGPEGSSAPAAAWRCASTEQWIIGTLDPYAGVDSPGAANQLCAPQGVIINEIRIDQVGTDNDEYFELKGSPGESLADYTYIVIGDGTTAQASGVIEAIVPLSSYSIGADGLISFAEATFTGGAGTADVILGVTGGNPLNFENLDNVTHMLVKGFTGTLAQDLDTNNDGIFDLTPWTEIADSVALVLTTAAAPASGTEWWYGSTRVGPDGDFPPSHVYRCTSAGDWKIGLFASLASDTAGSPNPPCTTCGVGAGNCHAVHETPGCVDVNCCELVCALDPTCCSVTWDQDCVNSARAACLQAGNPPAVSFNEIRIDQPGGTDPDEYIELVGAPGTSLNGVSIIVLGDGSDDNGVVEAVVSLNGQSIPKDGTFLVAESTFTLGLADFTAPLNLESGNSVTYFLVWNFTGLNFTDYDVDNDCVLDSQPWDATIDSLGVVAGDSRCVYSPTTVGPDYFGLPAHLVRCLDGSWRFGRFETDAKDGYDTPGLPNTECPEPYACGNSEAPSCYTAHAGVGCGDESCCRAVCVVDFTCCEVAWDANCADQAELTCFVPSEPPAVFMSEIRIDQPSFDVDEYFEIGGEPGTLLNGLTYIVIGDGATALGSGVIEFAQSFNGFRIPESGFFLAARSTLTIPGVVPDLILPAQPEFENSDNVTHMLVFGFTGLVGQDLDLEDDGELDVTPWATMVQSVALLESTTIPPTGTEWAYGEVRVGPDPNSFVPSQVAYCPATETWTIGTFAVDATLIDSPGAPNFGCDYSSKRKCRQDLDGDGSVGASDLATVLAAWGTNDAEADLDGDGLVGASDLATILAAWGACP
jgi:hypothetical protein